MKYHNWNQSFTNFGKNQMTMQTASFSGVVKAIFYFIIFYYLFKFVMRLVLPILLQKAAKKAEENLRRQSDGDGTNSNFQDPKSTTPKSKKKVGEYVDFEEIE